MFSKQGKGNWYFKECFLSKGRVFDSLKNVFWAGEGYLIGVGICDEQGKCNEVLMFCLNVISRGKVI